MEEIQDQWTKEDPFESNLVLDPTADMFDEFIGLERQKKQDRLVEAFSKMDLFKSYFETVTDQDKKRSMAQLINNQMSFFGKLTTEQMDIYKNVDTDVSNIFKTICDIFIALDAKGFHVVGLETAKDTIKYSYNDNGETKNRLFQFNCRPSIIPTFTPESFIQKFDMLAEKTKNSLKSSDLDLYIGILVPLCINPNRYDNVMDYNSYLDWLITRR